jgi:hypothetical protein
MPCGAELHEFAILWVAEQPGGKFRTPELAAHLADLFKLTKEQLARRFKNGGTVWTNHVAWLFTHLWGEHEMGYVESLSEAKVYKITKKGRTEAKKIRRAGGPQRTPFSEGSSRSRIGSCTPRRGVGRRRGFWPTAPSAQRLHHPSSRNPRTQAGLVPAFLRPCYKSCANHALILYMPWRRI